MSFSYALVRVSISMLRFGKELYIISEHDLICFERQNHGTERSYRKGNLS